MAKVQQDVVFVFFPRITLVLDFCIGKNGVGVENQLSLSKQWFRAATPTFPEDKFGLDVKNKLAHRKNKFLAEIPNLFWTLAV